MASKHRAFGKFQLAYELKSRGCTYVRQTGSNHQMWRDSAGQLLIVGPRLRNPRALDKFLNQVRRHHTC